MKSVCDGCGHESRLVSPNKDYVLTLIDEWGKGSAAPEEPTFALPQDVPIIVNLGVGVDSVAMLVAMVQRNIKPDYILFADVGDEKPETYAYRDFFSDWLQRQGFPAVTTVRYRPETATYDTLEGNCLTNETLPSISISGKGSCTLKFKACVMDRWLLGACRGPWKGEGRADVMAAVDAGKKPVKLIGYDYGPADSCRFQKAVNKKKEEPFEFVYPLQQFLKWTREDCILEIIKAGLPVPVKSACFMCGGSKRWELKWLAAQHPDLLIRSLKMEDIARDGKHGFKTTKGLGRSFNWRDFCEDQGIVKRGAYEIIADPEALIRQVREEMPPLESNLDFELPIMDFAA